MISFYRDNITDSRRSLKNLGDSAKKFGSQSEQFWTSWEPFFRLHETLERCCCCCLLLFLTELFNNMF